MVLKTPAFNRAFINVICSDVPCYVNLTLRVILHIYIYLVAKNKELSVPTLSVGVDIA